MPVRFILGRSGAGKSSYCVESIVGQLRDSQSSEPLLLLVPEQASFQAESSILASGGLGGYSRLNVVSFDRFGFLLAGRNTPGRRLGRIGQRMIIQRILRENSDKLKLLSRSAEKAGTAQRLAETISELCSYAKTAGNLDEFVGQLQKADSNGMSGLKFGDIGLVFNRYLEFIEGRFIDPDVQLEQLRRAVSKADIIRGAKVWVDGFSGFSGSELAILIEILKASQETNIALCLDPSQIDNAGGDSCNVDLANLFYPTQQTYFELCEIIRKCGLEIAEPVILKDSLRFSGSDELRHIERQIFKTKAVKTASQGNVRIMAAADARAEVEFVARQIQRLVREGNCRYRDIAVIASDIDNYDHYIRGYFADYQIPFFIDKRKGLAGHYLAEFVRCALTLVTEGFSHSDVFAYLKNPLVPAEDYQIDLLENYCLAFGVDGSDWLGGDWCFDNSDEPSFDQQMINKIRQEVTGPLMKFRERLGLSQDISAKEFTATVFDLLDELNITERISEWVADAIEKGDPGLADEHRQFYGGLVDIFDEVCEVFEGMEMGCSDFTAVLNSAFSQMRLGFIPPGLDQVLVGSIERSRHPNLKAVFLIGATQKQFPSVLTEKGILTDADRAVAARLDFDLGPGTNESLAERKYLAYIAFTRASEFLCVSYPATDQKGTATVKSGFVSELEELFEDLRVQSFGAEQISFENIYSESEFTDLTCRDIAEGVLGKDLLDEICSDRRLGEAGKFIRRAIDYDNKAVLEKAIAKEFFADRIASSVTRVGTFAECPYRHFARYILGLKEREEFKLRPLEMGGFYHQVLDGWLKKAVNLKIDFESVSDEELIKILNEQMLNIVQSDSFISNFAGRNRHNSFIINSAGEILEDFVVGVAAMIRAGRFRPAESEVWFGDEGELELRLSNGRCLVLRGRIDRLDVFETGDEKIGIIFDYKRTERSFSWSKFYHGLDVQLPVYMLAVGGTEKGCTIAGAFYQPIEVGVEKIAANKLDERNRGFKYKAKGIFNGEFADRLDSQTKSGWSRFYSFYISSKDGQYGDYGRSAALKPDDFEKVLGFARDKVAELAEGIVAGAIEVCPYKLGAERGCQWCEYGAVCRFDWLVNDYNELETVDKKKLLAAKEASDG